MTEATGRRGLSRRGLLASTPLLLAPAALVSGCGYLLYPERNGRKGGRVDTVVLVVDLLWLLPGLVPGLICLSVDFATGCIYAPLHGRSDEGRRPPEQDTVRAASGVQATVQSSGSVRAAGTVEGRRLQLAWGPGSRSPADLADAVLVFTDGRGRKAEAPLGELGLLG